MNEQKFNMKKVLIIAAVVLAICVAGFLIVYFLSKPAAAVGTKAYTLTVIDDNQHEKVYSGKTDAQYLSEIMDALSDDGDFSYEGESTQFGITLYTVNGLRADFNTSNAYWAIYVNGEYGMYAINEQPVADGDEFTLKYENMN